MSHKLLPLLVLTALLGNSLAPSICAAHCAPTTPHHHSISAPATDQAACNDCAPAPNQLRAVICYIPSELNACIEPSFAFAAHPVLAKFARSQPSGVSAAPDRRSSFTPDLSSSPQSLVVATVSLRV